MTKIDNLLSEFKLERFSILESHFKVIPAGNEKKLPVLPVEIDFDIFTADPNLLRIVLKVDVNKDATMPGYSFSIVSDGIFSLPEKAEEAEKANYTNFSALPLMINSVRAYIMNISAYSFHGQYMLPLIDVNNLLKKKLKTKS